jgi:ribosomal protein S27AE
MVSSEVEARLRFLEQASEALAVTAPTVSSFMRASKREAASYHEVETTESRNVCDGCGQLLLIGWSCEAVRTGEHKQTRQQRISGKTTTTKCVQCSACGTGNTIQHHKRRKTTASKTPSKVKVASPKTAVPAEQPIPTPLPEQTPVASPLPSKEQTPEIAQAKPTVRRKARNKNASLQALLANKKPEAPKASGYGLDFMDFMK